MVVAPNVLDPHYVASEMPEGGLAEWHVDVEKWTATLMTPETQLGKLTLPLEPMVGCFGVAPPRGQAISTATLLYTRRKHGLSRFSGRCHRLLSRFCLRRDSFFSATDTPYRVTVK